MDFPVQEQHQKLNHATLNIVLLMENILHGQTGHNVATLAEVDNKPGTASAHRPNMEVKDVKFLAMPWMNANVILSCVL